MISRAVFYEKDKKRWLLASEVTIIMRFDGV